LIILVTGILIFTGTSAFSPRQNEIPENDQFLTYISNGEPEISNKHVEEKNLETSLEIIPDKVNSNSLVVERQPDSVKKEAPIGGTIQLEIDEKGNLIKVTKNGIELNGEEKEKYEKLINRDKALEDSENNLKKVQEELEKSEEILKASREKMVEATEEYNKAMEFYYQTLASTNDNKDLGAWSLAVDDYSNALILSEMADSNYFDLIWDFSEDWAELEKNELLEKFEDFEIDEQFDISFESYEDALKLQELEMDLINDRIDLQIEELQDLKLLEMEMGVFENKIRSELVRDNLLDNEDDELSFKISRKKLEVNGKKQSKALHEKYLNLCEEMYNEKFDDNKTIMIID